jgi:hypothetical protein
MPVANPETKGIDLLDEKSGKIEKIRLGDNPINRFSLAIAHEFGDDESRFFSIMNRIAALARLLADDKRIEPYLKVNPNDRENPMINNAVINVMAQFPIFEDGEFDRDAFFSEVRKAVENESPHRSFTSLIPGGNIKSGIEFRNTNRVALC